MSHSVIIIDDDPDLREVLSEFLRLKDINVLATGTNGKDAVELYQKHQPDAILMNLTMPKYDGFYGIKKIRKIDSNAKIVIITASSDGDKINELTEMGISIILEKPRNMNRIVEILNKLPLDDLVQPHYVS